MIFDLFTGVTVSSTVNSTHYETPNNHEISSVQIVIGGTATAKAQVCNEQTPVNWNDLTSGDTATAMYSVGAYYRHIRASVTAWTTGDVDVHVGYKRIS